MSASRLLACEAGPVKEAAATITPPAAGSVYSDLAPLAVVRDAEGARTLEVATGRVPWGGVSGTLDPTGSVGSAYSELSLLPLLEDSALTALFATTASLVVSLVSLEVILVAVVAGLAVVGAAVATAGRVLPAAAGSARGAGGA